MVNNMVLYGSYSNGCIWFLVYLAPWATVMDLNAKSVDKLANHPGFLDVKVGKKRHATSGVKKITLVGSMFGMAT